MQLRIAICDDEEIISNKIKEQLKSINSKFNITTFNSGEQLLNSKETFDLILLDIEMKGLDGIETANLIRKRKNKEFIIFLTSHSEFMPEAFKVKAFRFLCKPLEMDKFKEAICEVEKEILNNRRIAINEKGKVELINIQDIIYVEAFGDGTYIYTKNDVLESNRQLKYWMSELGTEHFFQTHRSYFVALRYIKKLNNNEVKTNYINHLIPISRRNNVALKDALFTYIKKYARFI